MKRAIGLVLMLVLFLMVAPALAQEWQTPQGRTYEYRPDLIQPQSLVPTTVMGPFAVVAVQKDGDAVTIFLHDESSVTCRNPTYVGTLAAIGASALVGGRPILLKVQGDSVIGYQIY